MKTLNQFNNFWHLRMSFDLKMQNLFEASNQMDYQNCGKQFYKKSISTLGIIESIIFSHPNNWSKLLAYCVKFILNLLKKHATGTNPHKKIRNTKIIKPIL